MPLKDTYDQLCCGRRRAAQVCGGQSSAPRVLFPGAFNPLHQGHRRIAEIAGDKLGTHVAFEISIANVDKPVLTWPDVERRVQQFEAEESVWLTSAPTFVEKAQLFPNVIFAVGIDTLKRIEVSQYYRDGKGGAAQAIQQIRDQGCRFLVFGRADGDRFVTLRDLDLSPELESISEAVSEGDFRHDVSSSEIRARQQSDRTID